MKENVFEVAPNRVWIIGYTPRALLTSLHCPKWGGMRRIHPLKVWGLKEGVYKLAKSALKILSPHLGKWGDLKCHPEIDMKIWSLYQRLLCKWFLKSLWIIYSEVYLKEEMTYSYIVSWTHTVIFYFFFFFVLPKLLEKELRGLWECRKPRDKQGQWSGYGGDRKTNLDNKHSTNNWDNKTSWIKLLSQVLTWDLFFAGNVRNSFRALTCKQMKVSRGRCSDNIHLSQALLWG